MTPGSPAPEPPATGRHGERERGGSISPRPLNAGEVKTCCAAAYDNEAAALLLGDAFHPGGRALNRRLAGYLRLQPRHRVLDVASGPGSSALLLAREHGVRVDGVDLGEKNLARARAAAGAADLAGRVRFTPGDAERLPFPDNSFDAIVCECAFCTFPAKETAAAEFARVLRPGGRAGIADLTMAPGRLDRRLSGLAGWIACLAGAQPLEDYHRILNQAGLRITRTERHDDALTRMIDQIEARLRVLRIASHTAPATGSAGALGGIDHDTVLAMTALAREAVAAGSLGYGLLIAEADGLPADTG